MARLDAIVLGGGHNGLVAATLLARAGRRVLVLEREARLGGAAVSAAAFPGLDARISRYSYLVSLFPRGLLRELGVAVELRRRRVSSYTPCGDAGLLIGDDPAATRGSFVRTLGDDRALHALSRFGALTGSVAQRVFGTLTEPLLEADAFARRVGDQRAWQALFERPLSVALEERFASDVARGIVATDALIGTFADLAGADLAQNRCFLYHVIGNGTGRWDVPVGGMGALTGALADAARAAGAQVAVRAPVVGVRGDGARVEVTVGGGETYEARHLCACVAPAVLASLIGEPPEEPAPEGSQLKLNLLLTRLPRLRDRHVAPEDAFAGTFHVNEGYVQLQTAYAEAAAGRIPDVVPCEAYCHSLTDPSILGPKLRGSGAHTLTVFALHMPARLFASDHEAAKQAAVAATLRSIDSVLAEPVSDCLACDGDGRPCLEAHTPVELEAELGLPGGHIFHRDLSWPFAEHEHEAGRWGVETPWPNVWLGGAGARRGGGVSGIPGHNAARAVLAADGARARQGVRGRAA
jgi:phytoene dehydrogenase-like protein